MNADSDKLQETLAQLHQQLDETASLDERSAEQLRTAIDDIEAALEKKAAQALEDDSDEGSLADRLSESAIEFEELHPTIAGTLRRLTDILAQMGI